MREQLNTCAHKFVFYLILVFACQRQLCPPPVVPLSVPGPQVWSLGPRFDNLDFYFRRQLCPFPEVHCWATAPPSAPRWTQFGYLVGGDYAQCLGPLCQRYTIVMLVTILLGAAYAMLK